ncbi:unnamed protein product, partial [Ascophyllum nodosum]
PETFSAEEFVFVVTDSSGGKAYGFCRRVLPCGVGGRYDTGRLRLPECLCLVSRRPFFSTFNSVLAIAQALRLLLWKPPSAAVALQARGGGDITPSAAGNNLEELLGQLLAGGTGGRGVPDPGQELVACGLRFVRPVDEHLSLNDVPVTPLLVRLGPRNFLRLWSAILCERRVLLVAEDVRTLSACVHAASAILYPFAWQHVYVPLLPTSMLAYVSAPMPFVIGVRYSQLEEVKQQPMNEAVFVHLERGELTGTTGMEPVPDICDGVKENLASATQKLDRALGKLAILTSRSRGGAGKDKDAHDRGSGQRCVERSGMHAEGINDTASTLFAEIKFIYGKAKKHKPALDSGGMATPDDHAIRAALLAFSVGLFGDHRVILRRHPQKRLEIDADYFIRHRREQRGDSEGVLRFLKEFTQSQMFHTHMMHIK